MCCWFPCFYYFVFFFVFFFFSLSLFFFCVSVYLVGGKFNCVTSSSAIAGIPGKKRKKTSYFLFFLYFSFYISFLLSRLGHSEMWVCSKHIYVHAHARVENDDQLVCPFFFTSPEGWLMTELCHAAAASFERGT